jgi:cytochrome d ubiquinol oxidase subunit II
MPLDDAVAGLLVVATITYAVLGGADFGGGIWDALARGPRKSAQREAIAHAMGPVWEANHVWLIFMVVLLFSAFPAAYARLSTVLFIPVHLVLVGIVLRGAAFVFRAYSPRTVGERLPAAQTWGAVFGIASLITPFLLGCVLGALASGDAAEGSWLAPTPILFGVFAVTLCAYVAAVYLCLETTGELREDFRGRALRAGTIVVVLMALAVPFLRMSAPHIFDGLLSARALPILSVGVLATLFSGAALYTRSFRAARSATIVQTACLIAGWAVAQHPYIIYPDMTVHGIAAPPATLRFILISTPFGMALLLPSLWLLFRIFKSEPHG